MHVKKSSIIKDLARDKHGACAQKRKNEKTKERAQKARGDTTTVDSIIN